MKSVAGHSRLVALLKRVLPLIALALLATLFLFRGERELDSDLTFSDEEVAGIEDGTTVTGPSVSGETKDGLLFDFRAGSARPGSAENVSLSGVTFSDEASVTDFIGTFDQPGGDGLRMKAARAEMSATGGAVRLPEGVNISTTQGYDLNADTASADATKGEVALSGSVEAAGPMGRIRADHADITYRGDGLTVVFRDRVKLVYDPAKAGEN